MRRLEEMTNELIELGKTVRESKKMLENRLESVLNIAQKSILEWEKILSSDELENALRMTFILNMAVSRGTNYYTWNEDEAIANDYIQWRKKKIKSKEKFFYTINSGFIILSKLFKSPFERSSRIIRILELSEDNNISYIYEGTSYNGFDLVVTTFHQKFIMDINNFHIINYTSSNDRYDSWSWLSSLNKELKKINYETHRKSNKKGCRP